MPTDNFDDKYWIEQEDCRFEFFPHEGKVICYSSGALLKAVHHFGAAGFDIDWSTFSGRGFTVSTADNITAGDLKHMLCRATRDLVSKSKKNKDDLLLRNWDRNKNKSICIYSLRASICDLKNKVKAKKKSRQDVADFFNRFNIEDDPDRISRGSGIMQVKGTNTSTYMIQAGKNSLEKLWAMGKLVKLTKEEWLEKVEDYKE